MTSPGERWLAAVTGSAGGAAAARLERGRHQASRGAVQDLEIAPGRVTARVREGRLRPRHTTLHVPTFDEAGWERVLDVLAGELRFTAALLEGRLPDDLAAALAAAGVPLEPSLDEVRARCDCGDPSRPCAHTAAVHHAVAAALDEDPVRLLELRGRDRGSVLAALRSRRTGGAAGVVPGTIPIGDLAAAPAYAARGDLDAIALQPRPVEDPAWLFHHLGEPPGVDDTAPLERHIAAAADFAWRLAAGEGAGAADVELVVAELRAQRFGTAASIAETVGWDVEATRGLLDELFEQGRVLRTGTGEQARYRAASA